jgi:hypothetical protein
MSGLNGDSLHVESMAVLEQSQPALTGRDSRSVHRPMIAGFSLPIRLQSAGVNCPAMLQYREARLSTLALENASVAPPIEGLDLWH